MRTFLLPTLFKLALIFLSNNINIGPFFLLLLLLFLLFLCLSIHRYALFFSVCVWLSACQFLIFSTIFR